MQRLCSRWRPLVSFMASAPPRWWPPALPRRVFGPMKSPYPPVSRVHRFPHKSQNMGGSSGVKSDEIKKLDMRLLISSANENPTVSQGMNNLERRPTTKVFKAHGEDVIYGDESACRTTLEVIDIIGGKHDAWSKAVDDSGHGEGTVESDEDEYYSLFAKMVEQRSAGVAPLYVLPETRHRDGSIYKNTQSWGKEYHIADHKETCLEAMMLTDPPRCFYLNGFCLRHPPSHMFQFFSLKLAEIIGDDGLVQLYGYVAVRDRLDPFRNYVVSFTRDAPITVEKVHTCTYLQLFL